MCTPGRWTVLPPNRIPLPSLQIVQKCLLRHSSPSSMQLLPTMPRRSGLTQSSTPLLISLDPAILPTTSSSFSKLRRNEFKVFRDGNRKLIDCLNPVVKVIHAFSGIIGEAASFVSRISSFFIFTFSLVCHIQVPFPPAGAIFAGLDILLAVRIL
jgi:hypothetical protein